MTSQTLPTSVPLGPALTEPQARVIYRRGEEAVVFALLTPAKQLAEPLPAAVPDVTPATPSAMVPTSLKNPADSRRKKPGRNAGPPGSRRVAPEAINRRVAHRLGCCPDCRGASPRTQQTRTRVAEDIPVQITPVVTEHTIHRDWCPQCQEAVVPVVTAALPGATPGNRVPVLSAWLHYGLGNTLPRSSPSSTTT